MANSRFNDHLKGFAEYLDRAATDPLGPIDDVYHKIVHNHWADKHVANPKPAAKAPDYYSDPDITSRPSSTPAPAPKPAAPKPSPKPSPKPAAPKPAAPEDPIRAWTNEELAAGAGRQGDARDAAYRELSRSTGSGALDVAKVRNQTASDSSYVINSEVERRSKKLRADADRNRNNY